MFFNKLLVKVVIIVFTLSLSLYAQDLKRQSVNIVQAFGIDNQLKYIIPDAISGDIIRRSNALVSLGYESYTHEYLLRDGNSALQFGWEIIGAQHYGPNNVLEMDILYFVKYARILPPSLFFNVDFTWGEGASYVFGTPTFDDYPYGKPNDRYPLLSYFMIDLDFYAQKKQDIHFFLRVHHRSGMYGLIAPVNVGTNLLGYGFRYFF